MAYTPLCSLLRLSLLKHSAELLLPCPKRKVVQKKVSVEEVKVTEAAELCRKHVSGTESTISLLALWVPTCMHSDKLLSFRVSMRQSLDWPFKHHKLNRQKYHTSLKKKITALPKSVWYLLWVCVLQQCTFPIPVSDNEQQYFWGVFAFWSPLWSNAIVHWQKRCEVQNKVMKLIWFPPPNPSIYMPLLY